MLDRGATPEAVSRIVHWEDISRDAATPKAERPLRAQCGRFLRPSSKLALAWRGRAKRSRQKKALSRRPAWAGRLKFGDKLDATLRGRTPTLEQIHRCMKNDLAAARQKGATKVT